MKVLGQDHNGRIVIDGEGERVFTDLGIPADSPAFLTNFVFDGGHPEKVERFDNRRPNSPLSGLKFGSHK